MSYDIYIHLGATEVAEFNCTSNMAYVWNECGAPLERWDGMRCGDVSHLLAAAVDDACERADYLRQFEPSNGWGSVDRCIAWMKSLRDSMEEWPDGVIRVNC